MPEGYIGIDNTAKQIKSIYLGQNNIASQIQKAYIGDQNGVARLWYQRFVPISSLPVGTVIKGIYGDEPFVIVHHGNPNSSIYDSSCDGTWILSQNCIAQMPYDSQNKSSVYVSSLMKWLDTDFYNSLKIKEFVKPVTLPFYIGKTYIKPDLYTGEDGYSARVFLLSAVEAGFYNTKYSSSDSSIYAGDGAKLDWFERTVNEEPHRAVTYNGNPVEWWMRTPRSGDNTYTQCVKPKTNGAYGRGYTKESHGVRPAMILPKDMYVDSSNVVYPRTFTDRLGNYVVGQTIKMDINGLKRVWRIAYKGNPKTSFYHGSCNGIWLVLNTVYSQRAMDDLDYSKSTVNSYLNTTFFNRIGTDSNAENFIKTVKIPYVSITKDDDNNNVYTVMSKGEGLSCKAFASSAFELGYDAVFFGHIDGAPLGYYNGLSETVQKSLSGTPAAYWSRTTNNTLGYLIVDADGTFTTNNPKKSLGVVPCVIMDAEALVENGIIIGSK